LRPELAKVQAESTCCLKDGAEPQPAMIPMLGTNSPEVPAFVPKVFAKFNLERLGTINSKQWNFFLLKEVRTLVSKGSALMLNQIATLFEFILNSMDKRLQTRRKMEKKSSTIVDPVAQWNFTSANRFQLGFLHAAQDNLRSTLSLLGVKFYVDLSRKSIGLERSSVKLRVSDLRAALQDVELITEIFVEYNYPALISTIIEGCSLELASECSYLDDVGGRGVRVFTSNIKPQVEQHLFPNTVKFLRIFISL